MKLPTEVARNHTPIIKPADTRRRELGHRAQADGTQAELAAGVEQVDDGEPQGLTWTPPAASCDATTRTAKPAPTLSSPNENLTGVEGSREPSAIQIQAKTGASIQMNIEFIDWNQLLGKLQPEDGRARIAIAEEVERRAGLFEQRPEERRGEEEQADDIEPLALLRRPAAATGTASAKKTTVMMRSM